MPARLLILTVFLTCTAVTSGAQAPAAGRDVRGILTAVARNIGADRVTAIQYSGGGMIAALGQAFNPGDAENLPRFLVSDYTRLIDYATLSSREEYVRQLPARPRPFGALQYAGGETGNESNPPGNRGGGQQAAFVTPQRLRLFVAGPVAWNVQGTAAPARQFEYGGGVDTAQLRQLEVLLTPHGFVKAALAAPDARLVRGNSITFRALGKYTITGTINSQDLVNVVRTWVPNPVVGDMLVESRYSEYRDFGGVKFPTYIHSHQGDQWVLGTGSHDTSQLRIENVVVNPPVAPGTFAVPPAVQSAQPPAVRADAQVLAPGVWLIGGAGANSVLVEFRDFLTVVEAPGNDARSQAVIAEAKRLVPGKPIRYVVNTHAHWDHAGGLRGYVAEGAAIITHQENVPFYDTAMFTRSTWTLAPDTLATLRSVLPAQPQFIGVTGRYVLSDRQWGGNDAAGGRVLEVYHLTGSPPPAHNEWNVVAFLPANGILINADMAGAPPTGEGAAAPGEAYLFVNRVIQANRLNVQRHVPIHGAPFPHADFATYVGDRVPYSSTPPQ
jgi:hypothetical protein